MPQLTASCTMFSDHEQSKVEADNKKTVRKISTTFGLCR